MKDNTPQITRRGRIKDSRDGEIITFAVPLENLPRGTVKLVCIVNVPGEGEDEAPVYVKALSE